MELQVYAFLELLVRGYSIKTHKEGCDEKMTEHKAREKESRLIVSQ